MSFSKHTWLRLVYISLTFASTFAVDNNDGSGSDMSIDSADDNSTTTTVAIEIPATSATTEYSTVAKLTTITAAKRPSDKYADQIDPEKYQTVDKYASNGATDGFKRVDRSIPDEKNDFKNPSASDPHNFFAATGQLEKFGKLDTLLGDLFVTTPLINRFTILNSKSFSQRGKNDLANVIQEAVDQAFEKSALSSFGKSMNKIRPHLAYAIAISWNVQHYNFNMDKINAKDRNIDQIQSDANKDNAEFEENRSSFGGIASEGQKSEVTAFLNTLEKNFEVFVIDVQLWAIDSTDLAYQVVKQVQKAMRAASRAYEHLDASTKLMTTNAPLSAQKIRLEAMHYQRSEMMHYIGIIPAVLSDLIDLVEKIKHKMQKSLLSTVNNAQVQNNKEIDIAKKTDTKQKLSGDKLNRSINKVGSFLKSNKNSIEHSERALSENIKVIEDLIEKKRLRNDKFLSQIERFTLEKLDASKQKDILLDEHDARLKKLRQQLRQDRKDSKCVLTPKKFFANFHRCKFTTDKKTIHRHGYCARRCFIWCWTKCYPEIASYTQTRYTDHQCTTKLLEQETLRLKQMAEVDRKNCEMKVQEWSERIKTHEQDQLNALDIYMAKVAIVDDRVKKIGETQAKANKINEEFIELIQTQKKEKMKIRAKLLQLQENQVRAQRVALLAKVDLQASMVEFTSITDSLRLTKIALREVQRALNTVFSDLIKFEVQLKSLKSMILDQMDNFADITRKLSKSPNAIMQNPFNLRSNMKDVYQDNLHAGIGLIVVSQLYDSIFSYMSSLDESPVGLYRPELKLAQNVRRFEIFVKKMNNQTLELDQIDDELEHIQNKKNSLNEALDDKGVERLSENKKKFIIDEIEKDLEEERERKLKEKDEKKAEKLRKEVQQLEEKKLSENKNSTVINDVASRKSNSTVINDVASRKSN